jgi:hypothetical protein
MSLKRRKTFSYFIVEHRLEVCGSCKAIKLNLICATEGDDCNHDCHRAYTKQNATFMQMVLLLGCIILPRFSYEPNMSGGIPSFFRINTRQFVHRLLIMSKSLVFSQMKKKTDTWQAEDRRQI